MVNLTAVLGGRLTRLGDLCAQHGMIVIVKENASGSQRILDYLATDLTTVVIVRGRVTTKLITRRDSARENLLKISDRVARDRHGSVCIPLGRLMP